MKRRERGNSKERPVFVIFFNVPWFDRQSGLTQDTIYQLKLKLII
jgi:hypothetical protein